jgi:hypothetical protein
LIEKHRPTVLLDEADRYVKNNPDLISVVDAGHKKNGVALRCIGDDQEPRAFSVWAPMVIAGIGNLAGTVEDRSIVLTMQRKPPGHKLTRFRGDRPPKELIILASQAARWAADNQITLGNADPSMPAVLSNRMADNWRPLLAVADLAGEEWGRKARAAAGALIAAGENDDDRGVELLRDMRTAFAANGDADLLTKEIVACLIEDEERPWATYGRGDKPITDRQIARLLGLFKIISTTIDRSNGAQAKGYRRADFEDAWAAYCPDQTTLLDMEGVSRAYERTSTDETGTSGISASAREKTA